MKYIFLFWLMIGICSMGQSQKTYSADIAEIVYEKCSSCHRPGEIGPMSLTNYDEVKSWGSMIKYVTTNKIMPPWQTDPTYSTFLGENYLSEDEISTISEWVDSGMQQGDVNEEPEFPDFPEGSVLGEPDLILEMEEEWLHEGNNQDNYRYFVLPTNLVEDRIVKAVEFRPGNSKIVHHALLFEDLEGEAAAKDAATPEYGFDGFGSFSDGGAGDILSQKQFPGYVPGQKPIRFPDGVGQTLHAGADIVAQIHYAPWPVDETDKSSINIFFMDEDDEVLERELDNHIMLPFEWVIGEQFFILPNSVRTFHGEYTVPVDVSLVNIAPHMHLLGKQWKVWMEKPDGEIVNLISVPEWDFNWQGSYYFDRYLVAPAGTVIHAEATYDNTVSNPNNPSNPPEFVTWGEGTKDEMYYLPIGYVLYQDGDENISFTDSIVSTNEAIASGNMIYPLNPNPVNDFAVSGFYLEKGQPLYISIYDVNGNKVRTLREGEFFNMGEHFVNFSTLHLAAGAYVIQMKGADFQASRLFIKQ